MTSPDTTLSDGDLLVHCLSYDLDRPVADIEALLFDPEHYREPARPLSERLPHLNYLAARR